MIKTGVYGTAYGSAYGKAARRLSGLAAALLTLVAAPAFATSVWETFDVRCIAAFERFEPVDTTGLVFWEGDDRTSTYHLPAGGALTIDSEPDVGTRACAVEGGVLGGFEDWARRMTAAGLYQETETPGHFLSNEWIEPAILVALVGVHYSPVVQVVETTLES